MPPERTRFILGLPEDGNLVRIPLLVGTNPWLNLSSAKTTTKATAITKTGTTAAITYASLRFLGLLVKVSASGMTGPVQFQVVFAQAQGGLQVIYGNQQGIIRPTAVTNLTKANVAWGAGALFIPGMRTKPKISRTQTIQAKVTSNFLTTNTGAPVTTIATVEAILSAIDDPLARRQRIELEGAEGHHEGRHRHEGRH